MTTPAQIATPAEVPEINRQIEAVRARIRAFWDAYKEGDDKAPCDDVLMPELHALRARLPPEKPIAPGPYYSGKGKNRRRIWVEV